MSLILGDNFSYQGSKPLDGRIKYDTLADMKAVADATMYEGCLAYCVATDKTYQWKSKNSIDESTGKWREYTSGGGGVTDYSELTGKPSIEGVELDGAMTADDLGLAKESDIPSNTSDLNNDSGFITKTVNDLVNYYLKTETDNLIAAIKNSRFEVVSVLPTEDIQTNVIYLVPKADAETGDVKDEYINLNGTSSGWEKIGSTSVDLSGYVTDSDLETALNDYVAKADMETYLADYALSEDVHNIPEGGTTGQVLKKVSNTDYDVEWVDDGGESSIVNGYAYATPIDYTSPMALINWVKAHTDKTITVPDESIFSGRTSNAFYMVLSENSGYYLFSQYPFTLKTHWLTRNSVKIFNSSRYTQDGVNHTGYNSGSAFTYANGIRYCNEVTIKGSSEVDLDYLADTEKTAQIFYTPDVNFDASNNAYADNETLIENKIKFYTDAQHTTEITPVANKIYVDVPTGKMYEWNGTEYTSVGGGDVPTKTSDLDNDSGFITKDVNNLTNYPTKTEVNTSLSGKQDTIQLSEMPTASAEYADKLVQFMGATTSTYVHGYFYECRVSNDTYSWVQTDVQPSGGAGGGGHTIEDSEGTSLTQRDTMQFGDGFNASDDSTNEKTVVEPNLMTAADMDDVVTPLPSVKSRYHKYSTEEQIVGEWIDGKPIYEKTFQLSDFTVTTTVQFINIVNKTEANIDLLVNYEGTMGWNNADSPLTIPFIMATDINTSIIQIDVCHNATTEYFMLRHYRNSGSTNVFNPTVTLRYTKTTS